MSGKRVKQLATEAKEILGIKNVGKIRFRQIKKSYSSHKINKHLIEVK